MTKTSSLAPVIPGFYPDPTVCKVGEDYYLANSSFEYFPGAPIFHSKDLINWTQIGNILNRRSQFEVGNGLDSGGIYGSTLRHHDGRFWFITTNMSAPESGQTLVWSENPAGPWSDPVFIPQAKGIDPDLTWDENGDCFLTWCDFGVIDPGWYIRQAKLDCTTGSFLGEDYPLWQGSGLPGTEGPHLYRIDDFWYLICAEGGTERGHSVSVARSRSISGPFENFTSNPIFTRRSTFYPTQNVGHADLVQTTDGSWAAVYLGVRPRGSTPGFHVNGRETYLAAVEFTDGWPVFHPDYFSIPEKDSSFYDDFSSENLDAQWVTHKQEFSDVIGTREPNKLTVVAPDQAGSLCFRVKDEAWTVEVDVVEQGELIVRLDRRHFYSIRYSNNEVIVSGKIGDVDFTRANATVAPANKTITLRIESVRPETPNIPFGHAGPDDLIFSHVSEGAEVAHARLDGRYLSTEVAGGFTGRMICLGETGDFGYYRSFRYESKA